MKELVTLQFMGLQRDRHYLENNYSAKDKRDFKMIAVNYDIPRNTHKLHCGLNSRCGSFFSLLICLS